MKRFLGIILTLFSINSLTGGDLSYYQTNYPANQIIGDQLIRIKSDLDSRNDYDNVAIVEYVLRKLETKYNALISDTLAEKKALLLAILKPIVAPEIKGAEVIIPLPTPTILHPTVDILDYNNVAIVEGLLKEKCSVDYTRLSQTALNEKISILKSCLSGTEIKPTGPKTEHGEVKSVPAPTDTSSAAVGPNMQMLIEKGVVPAGQQVKKGDSVASEDDLAKYAKMTKTGVPAAAVAQKMSSEGFVIGSGSGTAPKPLVLPTPKQKTQTDTDSAIGAGGAGGAGGDISDNAQDLLKYVGNALTPAERAVLATKSDNQLNKFMMGIRASGPLKQSADAVATNLRKNNFLAATSEAVSPAGSDKAPAVSSPTDIIKQKRAIIESSENDAIKQFMKLRDELYRDLELAEIQKLAGADDLGVKFGRMNLKLSKEKDAYSTADIIEDLRKNVLPNLSSSPVTPPSPAPTPKPTAKPSQGAAKSKDDLTNAQKVQAIVDYVANNKKQLNDVEKNYLSSLGQKELDRYFKMAERGSKVDYIKNQIQEGLSNPAKTAASSSPTPKPSTPKPTTPKPTIAPEPLAVSGEYGPNVNALISAGVELNKEQASSLNDSALSSYLTRIKMGTPPGAVKQTMIKDGLLTQEVKKKPDSVGSAVGGAGGPSNPTQKPTSSPTGPQSLVDELRKRQGTPKPTSSTSVAAKGTSDASAAAKATAVNAKVEKYAQMVKRRASDEEILAALMAPQPVNQETLEAVIPIDSTQDINDMSVLDYLLKTKYGQPQDTLDKMYPYFKIIDVKRHLLPKELKNISMNLPMKYDTYYKYKPDPTQVNFPNTERLRDQYFARDWIEFPSSSMPRHLDYSRNGANPTVYLMNSDMWINTRNDYSVVRTYENVANYYWNPNGENFTLVFNDGKYQSYRGEDGSPIGPMLDLPKEVEEIIDIDETEAESEAATTTSIAKKSNKPVQMPGETDVHFRARQQARLDAKGRLGIGNTPTAILAGAIQGLDNTFKGLSDENIQMLRDYAEGEGKTDSSINELLKLEPYSASLLDKAKIYIAIHSDFVIQNDENKSDIEKWRDALSRMVLENANLTDLDTASKVKINSGIRPDSELFMQTFSKFSKKLSGGEIDVLGNPNKYVRNLGNLLRENPATASELTKAKLNYALIGQWIDLDAPQNESYLGDIAKWKEALGIN